MALDRLREWERAGLVAPAQAEAIRRYEARLAVRPTTWEDLATSCGALAACCVVAVLLGLSLSHDASWRVPVGFLTAGMFLMALGVYLRAWLPRRSELLHLAGASCWLAAAFLDPRHAWFIAAPLALLVYAAPFVGLRAETGIAMALLAWPAVALILQSLPATAVLSATELQAVLVALQLALTALSLPATGPWRQLPRALLVAGGFGVALLGAYALVVAGSLRGLGGIVLGSGVAAAAAWLLAPQRIPASAARLPRLDLDRLRVA